MLALVAMRSSRSELSMSVDSHAHVFVRNTAMAADRRYTPEYDATISQYLSMLDENGSTHGVLIQPSFLGTNNGYLLQALAQHSERLRAVVVLDPGTDLATLRTLRAQGVVGVRLNLIGQPDPQLASPLWRLHLGQLRSLGWQVEVHAEAARLRHILPPLIAAGLVVVVDHFGRPDARLGVEDPGFRYLLEAASTRRVYVKLSGAYRLGPGDAGERIALEAAALLLKTFGPDRLLWGSDWPHTQFETVADARRARLSLDNWVPDPAQRRMILSATASHLFGFGVQPGSKSGAGDDVTTKLNGVRAKTLPDNDI
jgi:predicted TIM-barrel fold metal-dependent hydrolase